MHQPHSRIKIKLAVCLSLAVALITLPSSLVGQAVDASQVNFSPGNQLIVNMDDTSNGVGTDFAIFQDQFTFSFDTSTDLDAFSLNQDAPSNTLALDEFGVGVGIFDPSSALHVFGADTSPFPDGRVLIENVGSVAQDRTLLDLQNNGPVTMVMSDNSVPGSAPYAIRAATDRLSIQQNGGIRPGLILFGDGATRFVANGVPNVTVLANGTMNIVGQPGGGNLNVIGPTGEAGDLFVKGNITYNGSLTGPSDRNIKKNFEAIDSKEILAKVAALPITKWNYKNDENESSHIGPMAQDFAASFQLGEHDDRIPLMDSDGVALAAIQGLNKLVKEKESDIKQLNETLNVQSKLIAELSARLERLEANNE